jgi:hypothetical protein
LAELAAVQDPAQVATAVGAALGIRDLPAVAEGDALAARQLLLVLDNCEQVIGAVAELCGRADPNSPAARVATTQAVSDRKASQAPSCNSKPMPGTSGSGTWPASTGRADGGRGMGGRPAG